MPKGKGKGKGGQQDNEGFPRDFLEQLNPGNSITIVYDGGVSVTGTFQRIENNTVVVATGPILAPIIVRINIDQIHSVASPL
ncbi:hypothetical protein ACFFIX_27660 [Metabacillus herbersteinensis]|uniref:KOW domain-containing protein n=1 Tax=Metabacillus herbersteinensis TaxID=283816 RepID=A0ABV6GMZ9_9BACI